MHGLTWVCLALLCAVAFGQQGKVIEQQGTSISEQVRYIGEFCFSGYSSVVEYSFIYNKSDSYQHPYLVLYDDGGSFWGYYQTSCDMLVSNAQSVISLAPTDAFASNGCQSVNYTSLGAGAFYNCSGSLRLDSSYMSRMWYIAIARCANSWEPMRATYRFNLLDNGNNPPQGNCMADMAMMSASSETVHRFGIIASALIALASLLITV